MAFANLSFEIADSSGPGCADGWTLGSHSVRAVAAFDSAGLGGLEPWEDFEEEWSSNQNYKFFFVGVAVDLAAAEFTTSNPTPKAFENFEEFWTSNQGFTFGFSGVLAAFDTSPENFEDFEEEWTTNESFAFAFDAEGTIQAVAGSLLIDGQTFTLDDGLNPPVVFEFDFVPISVSGANIPVPVTLLKTAAEVAVEMVTQINTTPNLGINARLVNAGDTLIRLINNISGTAGNQASAETVTNPGFVISNMSGGHALTIGSFDTAPQAFENFEEDWTDPYNFTFTGTAGLFDVAPEAYEDFEEDYPTVVMVTI